MSKLAYFSLLILLNTATLNAQIETNQTKPQNDFTHLVSTKDVVYQLRKNYGIEGSVLLSKTVWQILNSFSNQQQAKNAWQRAINDVAEIEVGAKLSVIDSQFNTGQVLIKYINGMSLEKWNKDRISFIINKHNLIDFFDQNDDLTIYLNLNNIWNILLSGIANKEEIQWHDVFENSLELFNTSNSKNNKTKYSKSITLFKAIKKWHASKDLEIDLADLLNHIESNAELNKRLYNVIIRYTLEKHHQHDLATSLTWFAVVEQLYLYKSKIKKTEVQLVNEFIEENDTWFLSEEQKLKDINSKLPLLIEDSIHNLKKYYKSIDTDLTIKTIIPTYYEMMGTQIERYMTTPFRQDIRQKLEICLNISEEYSPYPQEPIDKNQFVGCINDLSKAAIKDAATRELSGSLTKVESDQALDRALQLPPWQIINIMYAHIATNDCLQETHHLVNPFEWVVASESLLWFADRWPAYMKNYPQNNNLVQVIKAGNMLVDKLPCLEKNKHQLLNNNFLQITQSWQQLKTAINQVAIEFSHNNLAKGSDIDLLNYTENQSNYRVEDSSIQACDAMNSCGVHLQLESSRALYGLFPNHLLLADQLQLGSLKLCYANVGWKNRRAASTHLENDSVANYFGNFSFTLNGFYDDDLVFSRELIDSQEYLYLFAENSDEVLETVCPLSIVGNKISTKLAGGTYGLVPNRLTFLTASRANETQIMATNWSTGNEWINAITTEEATVTVENKYENLVVEVSKAYQQKASELQNTIYKVMLGRVQNLTEMQQQLNTSFKRMQREIKLFSSLNYTLQLDRIMSNDILHGLFYGENKIPDEKIILESYENQININQLIANIDENITLNQEKWNALADSLSNSHIKNILFRLKSLIE